MLVLLSHLLSCPNYPTFGYRTFGLIFVPQYVHGLEDILKVPLLPVISPLTHALKMVQEKFVQQR
jgi:hypothetical protein